MQRAPSHLRIRLCPVDLRDRRVAVCVACLSVPWSVCASSGRASLSRCRLLALRLQARPSGVCFRRTGGIGTQDHTFVLYPSATHSRPGSPRRTIITSWIASLHHRVRATWPDLRFVSVSLAGLLARSSLPRFDCLLHWTARARSGARRMMRNELLLAVRATRLQPQTCHRSPPAFPGTRERSGLPALL